MDEFLIDYNRGFDGIIRKLTINNFDSATVEISVCKSASLEWVNVRFNIHKICEVQVFQKFNTSSQILSDGIAFCKFEKFVVLDLNPYGDGKIDWNTLRRSDVYFVAGHIDFHVLPYSECNE